MVEDLSCFKAYDVRGRVPGELNEDLAYRIGRAYVDFLQPRKLVVGHDVRLTSESITDALVDGLTDGGSDVHLLGVCGTEEVYFATFHFGMDGGIIVTASHNPKDYNGMKFVRDDARPISGDTGLAVIKTLTQENRFKVSGRKGKRHNLIHRDAYLQHLLSYVDVPKLKPLKIVENPGNGGAGSIIDGLEHALPFEFVKVHHGADGNFPNGVPNPLVPANRAPTMEAIKASGADIGIAWDGDFDRCFFFDQAGGFVEGYYIVGLLAEAFLTRNAGARIVHDPRLTWNTEDIASMLNGTAICSKTGHAFMKERMRIEDAIYGGEMSAHHYFRDFSYCDSGMIPWLLVCELMSERDKSLAALVEERMALFPVSGEINRRIDDPAETLERIKDHFEEDAVGIDFIDGLSMSFKDWRFNVRKSNTEPVVRLNVESRADYGLMQEKTDQILGLMGGEAA